MKFGVTVKESTFGRIGVGVGVLMGRCVGVFVGGTVTMGGSEGARLAEGVGPIDGTDDGARVSVGDSDGARLAAAVAVAGGAVGPGPPAPSTSPTPIARTTPTAIAIARGTHGGRCGAFMSCCPDIGSSPGRVPA